MTKLPRFKSRRLKIQFKLDDKECEVWAEDEETLQKFCSRYLSRSDMTLAECMQHLQLIDIILLYHIWVSTQDLYAPYCEIEPEMRSVKMQLLFWDENYHTPMWRLTGKGSQLMKLFSAGQRAPEDKSWDSAREIRENHGFIPWHECALDKHMHFWSDIMGAIVLRYARGITDRSQIYTQYNIKPFKVNLTVVDWMFERFYETYGFMEDLHHLHVLERIEREAYLKEIPHGC